MDLLQRILPNRSQAYYLALLHHFTLHPAVPKDFYMTHFQTVSGIILEETPELESVIDLFFQTIYSNPSRLVRDLLERYQMSQIRSRALEENMIKLYNENRSLSTQLLQIRGMQMVQEISKRKNHQSQHIKNHFYKYLYAILFAIAVLGYVIK